MQPPRCIPNAKEKETRTSSQMNCGLIAPTLGDRQSRARVNVHITRLVGGGGHHHSALFADPTNNQQAATEGTPSSQSVLIDKGYSRLLQTIASFRGAPRQWLTLDHNDLSPPLSRRRRPYGNTSAQTTPKDWRKSKRRHQNEKMGSRNPRNGHQLNYAR